MSRAKSASCPYAAQAIKGYMAGSACLVSDTVMDGPCQSKSGLLQEAPQIDAFVLHPQLATDSLTMLVHRQGRQAQRAGDLFR